MTVRYGGRRVLHDPFFTHEAFELIISPSASTIELDDVRVWGGAVAASLRKLVAGGKAADSDEAKRLEEGRTAGVAVVLARVDEPFSRAVRAEVRDLDGEARDLFVRARDSEGARSFSDAALLLQEASVIEPESAVILWRAGWNLQFSGDHRLSEKALRRAVEVDDEFAPAWRELGAVMSLLERDDEAIKAYDRALELDPEDAVTYALKGQVLQGRGQLDAALALYEEAQALKPRSEAWNLLVKGIRRLKTPPKWESSWTSSTEHFEVMTNVSDEFAQLVARRLEIYRSFLTRMIPPREGQVSPVSRVWIFDARREYNVFAGTMMSRTAEHTAGVYHPAIRTLLLFDDVDRDATFDTLYHEAFHQYLDKLNRTTPIWFNEGMAEFFGAVELDDTKVIGVGLHHERLTELRLALRDAPERIPDLDEIALMPKVDFYDRDEASLHYAVAWSLCHFFMTGRDSDATELFRLYSRAIFAGKSGEDAYAASFGAEGARPVDSFRSSWLRHVRRLR